MTTGRILVILTVLVFTGAPGWSAGVAGGAHILITDPQPAWIPIAGGSLSPIRTETTATGFSAAFAFDEFALTWVTRDGLFVAWLQEGALSPRDITVVPGGGGSEPPKIVRSGETFVVAWRLAFSAGVRIARVDDTGAVLGTVDRDTSRHVHGLSATRELVLLVEERLVVSRGGRHEVFGTLLDAQLNLVKRVLIAQVPALGTNSLRTLAVAPLAGGFFATALRTDGSGTSVIGVQIRADGTVLPAIDLGSGTEVIGVDLVSMHNGLAMIVKRPGIGRSLQFFIDASGAVTGPARVALPILVRSERSSPTSTVRLPDGTLALVSVHEGQAIVSRLTLAAVAQNVPFHPWMLVMLAACLIIAGIIKLTICA